MTLQYLASQTAARMGVFGTRQFPLGPGEHVISLFGEPTDIAAGKQFGVNGQPGNVYTVPAGRQLRVYQLDFAGTWTGTGAPPSFTCVLMDSLADGTNSSDVAAFYPDVLQYTGSSSAYEVVYNEKNDIDRTIVAGRQPRCRVTSGDIFDVSLELYGIEGPA